MRSSELLDRRGHRVGQVGLVHVDAAGHALTVLVRDAARARRRRRSSAARRARPPSRRRSGCSSPIVKRADDLGARAHHDVVAERGMPLLALEAGAAERHALEQGHVLADLRRLADHDAHAVVDEEAAARGGPPGWISMPVTKRATCDTKRASVEPAPPPEPVADPVEGQRVDARIAEHDLERRARGRIALAARCGCRSGSRRTSRLSGRRARRAPRPAARRPPRRRRACDRPAARRAHPRPPAASGSAASSTARPAISSLAALAAAIVGPQP